MKSIHLIWAIVCASIFCSCANPRLQKIRLFATVGKVSSQATQNLYDEAAKLAVDADTTTLLKVKTALGSEEERRQQIIESNSVIAGRVQVLAGLKEHAFLLGKYFSAMEKLANSSSPQNVGQHAASIAQEVQKIGSTLKGASVGDQRIANLIGAAAQYVVVSQQIQALDAELSARARVIERELELQTAALKAVDKQMKQDVELLRSNRLAVDVVAPYSTSDPVPEEWVQTRNEVIRGSRSLEAAAVAIQASEDLKKSYLDLLANKLSTADLQSIAEEFDATLKLLKTEKE